MSLQYHKTDQHRCIEIILLQHAVSYISSGKKLRGQFYVREWERMVENANDMEEGWSCWGKHFINFVINI